MKDQNDFLTRFEAYFNAASAGFYVQSSEEDRVDSLVTTLASRLGLKVKEWNQAYGWVDFESKRPLGNTEAPAELARDLSVLLDENPDGHLFVIKNARLALEQDKHAVARLRQLLQRLRQHHATKSAVMLVAESISLPKEIEALITLLPLPLLSGAAISTVIDQEAVKLALEIPDHLRPRLLTTCRGMSLCEIVQVLRLVRQKYLVIDERALKLVLREKEQIIAKSGVLEMVPAEESLEDIGGMENLKAWLQRKTAILHRIERAKAACVRLPKGALLAGMPGCGKSLSAKVAAHEFGQPLLRLDIGSLLGKYVGESEHNMRRALSLAEAVSPCVLWIDELEKAFVGLREGASEVSARLLGNFLTWLQENTKPVFVIATANDITLIPPELLRKGRFDEVFYAGFPSLEERKEIFRIHLRRTKQREDDFDLDELAGRCRDFTGADIQNSLNDALEKAFIAGNSLDQKGLMAAISDTVPLRETLREQVGKYEELFEKLRLRPASNEGGMSVAKMTKLAIDPNPMRRKEVAEHPDCPDDLLEKLAQDADFAVKRAVFSNAHCPERVLAARIAQQSDAQNGGEELLELACLHEAAPADLLLYLLQGDEISDGLKKKIIEKPRVRYEMLCKGCKINMNEWEMIRFAEYPDLPSHAVKVLVDSRKTSVHEALAKNGKLPPEFQDQFARYGESVRLALARNAGLTVKIQEVLAGDKSESVRKELASNPSLTSDVRNLLAEDMAEVVRRALSSPGQSGDVSSTPTEESTNEDFNYIRENW